MNLHRRTALYSGLAAASALIGSASVDAVQLSAEGRGQALLYPYYTTRADNTGNAFATLLSVVNATPSAKAVKVRFLEGRNSREVLNFNLFLSPFDLWTAAILPDVSSGGAKIGTLDLSCTLPAFSASMTAPFVNFANFAYSGFNDDNAGTGLDRAKEGHFEIIEMATFASSTTTGRAVTHVSGVPLCTMPGGPTTGNPFPPFPPTPITDAQAALDAQAPTGGLFGGLTLLNVNSGTEYTADATALANFYQVGTNYQPVGSPFPDLTQATPPVSSIHAPNGSLYESAWAPSTADAVSAVLMHDSVMNEYVLDTGTRSQTDWIVTMPTKRHYVGNGTGGASRLFQRNFNGSSGSCDDVVTSAYDREERVPSVPLTLPGQPAAAQPLCWSANVVTFNTGTSVSGLFGSTNIAHIGLDTQNGWINLSFASLPQPDQHRLVNAGATTISGRGAAATTGNTVTYVGLPVIGFAASSYTNGALMVGAQNVLSNYGGTFVHKTSTTIQ